MTDVHALQSRLLRRMSRLNRAWNLIEAGDRIMVACSGGKDSWAMLHALRAYEAMVPFSFDLVAMTLDQGHPGFDAKVLVAHFEQHGFAYHVESRDTYSVVKRNTPAGKTYCSRCSRMRRGILHRVARELGATKIALGHHRDDVIETVLMSMMFSGQIRAMPPKLEETDHGCPVIRPLASCAESDLGAYAQHIGAPIVPCDLCGSQPSAQRQGVKALLAKLEADNPQVRQNLFASLSHVRPESLYDTSLRGHISPPSTLLPVIEQNSGKLESENIFD